jgi:hypothetical protein
MLKFPVRLETVELLLQSHPELIPGLLHLAAWAGYINIVWLLLTTGVRVTQINLKVSLSL